MTLVKSLYSGDPDVIRNTELARCQLCNKLSALQVLFSLHPSAVHVFSCMFMQHMHWGGAMSRAHMQMFQIAINKLSGWLFSRVLVSHAGGLGSIPCGDISVLGPLDQDTGDSGQVSLQYYIWIILRFAPIWGIYFGKKTNDKQVFFLKKENIYKMYD